MANPFPNTLADIQTEVSGLINDPTNTRYPLSQINQVLDIVQDRWNLEAQICRTSATLISVAGQSTYALNTLTGTFMKALRVAHKGIALIKRSKQYFDQFTQYDWTTTTGTPSDYYIDLTLNPPVIGLRPQPTSNDAGVNLLVEYLVRHTSMVNSTDTPFMIGATANALIAPYAWGVAYEAAAIIMEPDPTKETILKAKTFRAIANQALSNVVQIYGDFDLDEPWKMQGGRSWHYSIANPSPFNP